MLLIHSSMSVPFVGPVLRALWKKKREGYFMQGGATAHAATYSVNFSECLKRD
jgi:hypothetical protein